MSDIQRLIRIAQKRNAAEEYTEIRFRALKSLTARFRRKAMEEGLSGNVVLESFLQGYVDSHPAVLAMIDQWARDNIGEEPVRRSSKMSNRDLEEIYAAARRGIMIEEETDG